VPREHLEGSRSQAPCGASRWRGMDRNERSVPS
jgi:hypothetical protein